MIWTHISPKTTDKWPIKHEKGLNMPVREMQIKTITNHFTQLCDYHYLIQKLSLSNSRMVSSLPKRNFVSVCSNFPSSLWQPLFYLISDLPVPDISYISCNMVSLCLASFTYRHVFKVYPMLQQESVLHSLLWLNNIPLYGQIRTTFCFSIRHVDG